MDSENPENGAQLEENFVFLGGKVPYPTEKQ